MFLEEKVKCPFCNNHIKIDSVRTHRNGKKRVYWECKDCDLSVMRRFVVKKSD